jgi:riboflavin synthase
MFTGIIEQTGVIARIEREGTNTHFTVKSEMSAHLKIDQSVSHSGVCLTVTKQDNASHTVTAIEETLSITNLAGLKVGSIVNLERCMLNNGRFDGHIVQGHVDQTGVIKSVTERGGSWLVVIEFHAGTGNITVEKGSVCVNGVSLTCFDCSKTSFTVAIIPYTYEHTDFNRLKPGDIVNLEFDIIGKYVRRLLTGS